MSLKNPNGPSLNRRRARASRSRKQNQQAQKTQGLDRAAKADLRRGAGGGLAPTSGPNRPLSAKKRRKLERKIGHAVRRKAEEEGEGGEGEGEDMDAEADDNSAEEKKGEDDQNEDHQMAVDEQLATEGIA